MDETRDTPEATDKDDAAMHTFSDATAPLDKWLEGQSDIVPTQRSLLRPSLAWRSALCGAANTPQRFPCSIPGSP
jgi:hypothetical protein